MREMPEKIKRRIEDRPELGRPLWEEYERRKRQLPPMEPDAYARACMRIAREMGI